MATTVEHAVRALSESFSAQGIKTARLDARILVGHVIGRQPNQLFAGADDPIGKAQLDALGLLANRRLAHEPVSRILGCREFWGMTFELNDAALDPRPDSETIVQAIIDQKHKFSGRPLRILDLGTGTGCLLLALLKEFPASIGLGVDIDSQAIACAAANAQRLNLSTRTAFQVSSWGANVEGTFDVIVSNPPYLDAADMNTLAPEVRFDPPTALSGGHDGLDAYRALMPDMSRLLAGGGWAAIEIGARQAAAVSELVRAAGLSVAAVINDLASRPRCVVVRKS